MRALASMLAAAALVAAGCGEDEAEPEEPAEVSPGLALAADMTDIYSVAIEALRKGDAEDEEARNEAAAALGALAADADELGETARTTVDGAEGEGLEDAATCLTEGLSGIESALTSEPGAEAQGAATDAGEQLATCVRELRKLVARLPGDSGSTSSSLVARVRSSEAELDAQVPKLVAALAGPDLATEATTTPDPGPETEPTNDPPPETGLPPASDLEPCTAASGPPCIDSSGEVIYTYGE